MVGAALEWAPNFSGPDNTKFKTNETDIINALKHKLVAASEQLNF